MSTTQSSSWHLWKSFFQSSKISEHFKKFCQWPIKTKKELSKSWACVQHTDPPFSLPSFCSGPPWHRGTVLVSQGQHLVVKFISHRGLSLFSSLLQNDRQNQNPIRLKASKKGRWTPSKQTKTVWNFDLKSTAVFCQQGLNSLTLPYLCYH